MIATVATVTPIATFQLTPMVSELAELESSVAYLEVNAEKARTRRTTLAGEGKCINGPDHGPPWKGRVRCKWCVWVHRHGVLAVLKMKNGPTPPPGYIARIRR